LYTKNIIYKIVYSFVYEKIFMRNRAQETVYYTIVSRMKNIRMQLGLSLTEMAALLGVKKARLQSLNKAIGKVYRWLFGV